MEARLYNIGKRINYTSPYHEDVRSGRKEDIIQKMLISYISSPYFIWTALVLIIHGKKWKKPIRILLILHWLLRSTGDLLYHASYLNPTSMIIITPENVKNWYIRSAFANIFWVSGEIVGDWYILLRTHVIINDKKKIKPVFIICVFYNIAKLCIILHYFIEIPRCLEKYKANPNNIRYMGEFGLHWYYIIAVIQICSFLYDLSIIISLRKNLFKQLNYHNIFGKNSFIEKFKRISEFRIFMSMTVTLFFLPILILCIGVVVYILNGHSMNKPLYLNGIEHLRRMVIHNNLNLIYIDQVLLKCYVNTITQTNDFLFNDNIFFQSSRSKVSDNKTYNELSDNNIPISNGEPIENQDNNSFFDDITNRISNVEESLTK